MEKNVEAMFHPKTKAQDRMSAAHWVFGTERGDFSFENCALLLGARPEVIRLRIHYEFWVRWIAFPEPFMFRIDPVPEMLEDQLYISWSVIGSAIGSAAWHHPGIRTADLVAQACKNAGLSLAAGAAKVHAALLEMGESPAGYLSHKNDSWYLTGRNPQQRAELMKMTTGRVHGNTVSWSKLF